MKLILVRHAKTEWNQEGRLQGRLDSPVLPQSYQHIERLAEVLADRYDTIDLLQEQCFGKYEGVRIAEIEASNPEIMLRVRGKQPEQKLCPQSESFIDVQQRASLFIDFIRQNHKSGDIILAVSHGNFIKALLASILNESVENFMHFNCAFSEINMDSGTDTVDVIRWGVATHLKGLL